MTKTVLLVLKNLFFQERLRLKASKWYQKIRIKPQKLKQKMLIFFLFSFLVVPYHYISHGSLQSAAAARRSLRLTPPTPLVHQGGRRGVPESHVVIHKHYPKISRSTGTTATLRSKGEGCPNREEILPCICRLRGTEILIK